MPVPVISLDKYLSGWDFSNSLLQLVGINCTAFDQLEKNDPVRDVLDFNNFVCPVLWQQFTGFCTEELEFTVFAHKTTDLVVFKETHKPVVFLHTTDVDSSALQSLHQFSIASLHGY